LAKTHSGERRVRVILMRYEPPDKEHGPPVGRYRQLSGYGKSFPVANDLAIARLWDSIQQACDLWHADELVAKVEAREHAHGTQG
jgi:hypothetical protein